MMPDADDAVDQDRAVQRVRVRHVVGNERVVTQQ
jgi:hypothetical protein